MSTRRITESDVEEINLFEGSVPDHQFLLSFNSDWMSSAFGDWWYEEGREAFLEYVNTEMLYDG